MRAFVGLHCCHYCRMDLEDIRTSVNCQGAVQRNRDKYDQDVAIDNVTATGVQEYSPFNRIPFFYVTESSGVDLMTLQKAVYILAWQSQSYILLTKNISLSIIYTIECPRWILGRQKSETSQSL